MENNGINNSERVDHDLSACKSSKNKDFIKYTKQLGLNYFKNKYCSSYNKDSEPGEYVNILNSFYVFN